MSDELPARIRRALKPRPADVHDYPQDAKTRDDRLERMMADPAAYFADARRRAREIIERDEERKRRRR